VPSLAACVNPQTNEDLKKMRKEIAYFHEDLEVILNEERV
jgi:hypothetical protein